MILLSFVLMYVWPFIYNALVLFGENIKDLGSLGAGIYAFFNRLLISVGLHHALNSVFWFVWRVLMIFLTFWLALNR